MNKPIQGLLIFILLAFIQACAIAPQEVWQKFAFDGRTDGWDLSTDLLEYDYGGHEKMAAKSITKLNLSSQTDRERLAPYSNVNGPCQSGNSYM